MSDPDRLREVVSGATALVTGSSFGIGEATARKLAAAGATVLLAARSEDKLDDLAQQINASGGHAVSYPADLSDEDTCAALAKRIIDEHGPPDIVVSNAGKSIRRPLHDQYERPHDFDRTIGINYLGPIWLLLGLLPAMRERGAGHVVNVSSVGVRVPPGPRWGAYQASKGAFDMWLRSVAPELHADGIDVTSIYMALIRTRMTAPTESLRNVPGLDPDAGGGHRREGDHRTASHHRAVVVVAGRSRHGAAAVTRGACDASVVAARQRFRQGPDGRPMTEGLVATGFRALRRSRLLTPPGPGALLRVGREVTRGGTNLVTVLGISAARWPNRTALIDDEGAVTYRELRSQTEALAAELQRRGVGPGHAVGVMCRNGRAFLEAVFAAAMVGADVVLLNTDFRTESLAAALSTHRIGMVICDNEFEARAHDADDSVTVIDAANAFARDGGPRPKVAAAGRIVLLTSGTTGAPKGVPRHPEIRLALGIGASILDRTGLRIGSRISVPVPMFHGLGFGMLVLTLGLGGTVLTRRRFDAEGMLAQASEHRAEALTVVPVMLARILDLTEDVRARNPLPSLRVVISSGARLDPSLAARFTQAYGDVIYNGYGSSEVGIGALATPIDLREAPETVGRPVVGCAVRILDENGAARWA